MNAIRLGRIGPLLLTLTLLSSCDGAPGPAGPPGPALTPSASAGAPTTGEHGVGELYMDANAAIWICRTAGTPGTWSRMVVADDFVAASYSQATSQTLTTHVVTTLDFETKIKDTHDAVTTGSGWKFTVPPGKAGTYQVSAVVQFNMTSVGGVVLLSVFKNEIEYRRLGRIANGAGDIQAISGTCDVPLAEGDTISIRALQTSAGDLSTEGYLCSGPCATPSIFKNAVDVHRIPGS